MTTFSKKSDNRKNRNAIQNLYVILLVFYAGISYLLTWASNFFFIFSVGKTKIWLNKPEEKALMKM